MILCFSSPAQGLNLLTLCLSVSSLYVYIWLCFIVEFVCTSYLPCLNVACTVFHVNPDEAEMHQSGPKVVLSVLTSLMFALLTVCLFHNFLSFALSPSCGGMVQEFKSIRNHLQIAECTVCISRAHCVQTSERCRQHIHAVHLIYVSIQSEM